MRGWLRSDFAAIFPSLFAVLEPGSLKPISLRSVRTKESRSRRIKFTHPMAANSGSTHTKPEQVTKGGNRHIVAQGRRLWKWLCWPGHMLRFLPFDYGHR